MIHCAKWEEAAFVKAIAKIQIFLLYSNQRVDSYSATLLLLNRHEHFAQSHQDP